MAKTQPRTMPGVMELLPRQQVAFQRMLATIQSTYERFGFVPVETPAIELSNVLLTKTGGETERQVYWVQSAGSRAQGYEPDLALRFDLTVPLARYVAQHEHELAFPFRRYQIQRVYRGESAQKGRYREFYQCDIDVIGKDKLDPAVDGEIPVVIGHVFRALDVGDFTISISNRKLLLGLLESLGVDDAERRTLVLREVDKLDKRGRDAVRESLTREGAATETSPARPALLDAAAAERVLAFVETPGTPAEVIRALEGMGVAHETFAQGLAELRAVVETVDALGLPAKNYKLNLAIARGLDYYTGTVYETFLDAHPGIGSVCSGGRYDNLAEHYTNSKLPGVGISIGATRLFYQLLEAGLVKDPESSVTVLVAEFDAAQRTDNLALASRLREAGVNTDVHLQGAGLKKQFAYANKAGIPFVAIQGPAEKEKGVVQLKDLAAGTQQELTPDALVAALKARAGR